MEKKQVLTISELLFIAVLSSALGVIWWGYTIFNDLFQTALKPIGFNHLFEGFWLFGAVFFPYVVRKPGTAILGEVIAAAVQGMIAKWGIWSLIYGLVQGLPVELFFLALAYKKWDIKYLCAAGSISAVASYILTYFLYGYSTLSIWFNAIQLSVFVLSGAVLAGIMTKVLADAVKKTGVLNQFKIAEE